MSNTPAGSSSSKTPSLLNSILCSMGGGGTTSKEILSKEDIEKRKAKRKKLNEDKEMKRKHELEQALLMEKKKLERFSSKVSKDLNEFIADDVAKEFRFPPFEKSFHTLVHEIAANLGLVSISICDDATGVARGITVYKAESAPDQEALFALRNPREHAASKLSEAENQVEKERKRKYDEIDTEKGKDVVSNGSSSYLQRIKGIVDVDNALSEVRMDFRKRDLRGVGEVQDSIRKAKAQKQTVEQIAEEEIEDI